MKNNQKGITLIALVVTIIVLLILAGVSIAMLTGQNGILERASEASYQTKLQNVAESMSYNVTEAITAYYNKNYVDNTATDGEATVEAAIVSVIASSMSGTTAASDTSVTVTLGTGINTTNKTISGTAENDTVTLSYGGHKKVGTVSTAGIAWDEIEAE